ncbi:MAG TPA: esterase-like activity of phytase family protein [Pseudorhizobium sp.]|nr:esterase-like activity of phytase family protein [Pseudorhizobium sp.]
MATPVATATPDVLVCSTAIERFVPGSNEVQFGKLRFIGGLQYTSADRRLGGVSSIRFRPDGHAFVSVLDTGDWMTGTIRRDEGGRLQGLENVEIRPMLGRDGTAGSKADMDAEGLALRQGQAVVSFERHHRIDAYPDPGFGKSAPRSLDMVISRAELRSNGGIEALVVSPEAGPLQGALVAVAEKSIDAEGNLFAAILEGPQTEIFKVVKHSPWDVTDGAFLPDGDLLLLERRFSFSGGIGMRIRRIAGDAIRPGARVDGEVLIEAGMSSEIDNMEGIDVIQGPNNETRIILVSDDNTSFLQRNLMLEFQLTD